MTQIDIADIAKAIRDAQARIKNDATNEDRGQQLRGVRRAAAHIAIILDNKAAINFLVACGYGAN